MLYDEDHLNFIEKLKRYVHLEVLLNAIQRDMKHLSHLKMASVYRWLLDQLTERMIKDLAELRQSIRRSDGKIIEIQQEPEARRVSYQYKGYQQEMEFLNELMKAECARIMKEYLNMKK